MQGQHPYAFAQELGQRAAAAFLAVSKMDGTALLAGKTLAQIRPEKYVPTPERQAEIDKKLKPMKIDMDDFQRWVIERSR